MLYSNDDIYIVGLTGMSGAGKTTACRIFSENGFSVIDCDMVARKVVEKGRLALKAVADAFSGDILSGNGELDRRKLGSIVFSDKDKLELLNTVIYPYITYYVINRIKELSEDGNKLVLLDAPTLFESGVDILCDDIVSVTADKAHCIQRIMQRDGLTREQAEMRLSSQHDASFYIERSGHYADNSGTAEEFSAEIADIARSIAEHRGE